MVIYVVTETEVQILRLTHAMRDPEAIQSELDERSSGH